MITVPVILLAASFILFVIAAYPKNLVAWGLACYVLAQLYPLIVT